MSTCARALTSFYLPELQAISRRTHDAIPLLHTWDKFTATCATAAQRLDQNFLEPPVASELVEERLDHLVRSRSSFTDTKQNKAGPTVIKVTIASVGSYPTQST